MRATLGSSACRALAEPDDVFKDPPQAGSHYTDIKIDHRTAQPPQEAFARQDPHPPTRINRDGCSPARMPSAIALVRMVLSVPVPRH